MAKCSGITQAGTACKGIPIDGSQWCYVHHPDHTEERRRHGKRGGHRGGRGRPVQELARLQARFEELAEGVLRGEVEKSVGAVVGQLLNGARACMATRLKAVEQEEFEQRLAELEAALEAQDGRTYYGA